MSGIPEGPAARGVGRFASLRHDRVTVPCVLQLHDTATGEVAPLRLRTPGRVSMYVCGPTVDGEPHLGHGRFSLVFDVLRRYLVFTGLDVTYVSNITDIDDKIIDRAAAAGVPIDEFTAANEARWWEIMDALGVLRPDETPHATAFVDRMVDLVADLVARGVAYETGDGVYLSVMDVPGYGLLAHQPLDSLRAGARVEADEEKRSPLDFVLWKKAKPGEPSWESPWGPGGPGWHTECVVMSLDLLGDGFDLHGGGQDLIFPHHENERAQAVAEGRDVRPPLDAQRLGHHGRREDVQVPGQLHLALRPAGAQRRPRLPAAGAPVPLPVADRGHAGHDGRRRGRAWPVWTRWPGASTWPTCWPAGRWSTGRRSSGASPDAGADGRATGPGGDGLDADAVARFRERMDDDLDTPGALAAVFDLVRRANAAADAGDMAARPAVGGHRRPALCARSGLPLRTGSEDEVDPAAAELVRRRDQARAAGDWALADSLRGELEEAGVGGRGRTRGDPDHGVNERRVNRCPERPLSS